MPDPRNPLGPSVEPSFMENHIRRPGDFIRLSIEKIDKEVELNRNSRRREFSIRDPDGYYLTIAEYHEFQG